MRTDSQLLHLIILALSYQFYLTTVPQYAIIEFSPFFTLNHMNTALLGLATFIAYGIAAILLLIGLQRPRHNTSPTPSKSAPTGLQVPVLVAVIFHGILLINIFSVSGLQFQFLPSLGLFSWIITLTLVIASFKLPLTSLGILLYPISGLCAAAMGMSGAPAESTNSDMSPLLQGHIFTSVFAYSLLSLAGLQAIILAFQDKHLHNHQPSGFIQSLPPLSVMEKLMFQIIGAGFTLLTIALVSGLIVSPEWFTHKIIFSLIAWILFAVLLYGRWKAGWRGKKAIRFTLGGIGFLMLAFFGSKLVLELIIGK